MPIEGDDDPAAGSIGELLVARQQAATPPTTPTPGRPRHRARPGGLRRLREPLDAFFDRFPGLDRPALVWVRTLPDRIREDDRYRSIQGPWFSSPWIPRGVLVLVVAYYVKTFVPLVLMRQRYYGTFDFDLGVFDQATWLLAHGRGFITIRGLPFLGHHLNWGLYLFAPFYWLGAGPNFLDVMVIVAYVAGAVVLTRIARYYDANEWYGVLLAVLFLFHDSVQNQIQAGFHPDKMAVPFILGAILAALHERWRWFAAMVVLTVIWKEDMALFVVMLGLAVAWKRSIRIGAVTATAAGAYFLFATKVLMPRYIKGGPFYSDAMGPIGNGPGQWLRNVVDHPVLYRTALAHNHAGGYLPNLARPYGLVSFLAPGSLLLAAPILFVNLLSAEGYTTDIGRQYAVVPLLMTTIGAVRGLLSRKTTTVRLGLCVVMVVASLTTLNLGAGPWSHRYRTGIWPLATSVHSQTLDRAIKLVPPHAGVAASYFVVPHLSHRPEVYTFPNPWHPENWGVHDQEPRSGASVDWIVVDEGTASQDPAQGPLLTQLESTGQFRPVFDQNQILVLQRIAPPG